MPLVIVDYRIDEIEYNSLLKYGLNVLKCPKSDLLYDSIDGHPDIQLTFISKNKLLVHKDMDKSFINTLRESGIEVLLSERSLSHKYPDDIILNALNINDHFYHRLANTDPVLLERTKYKLRQNISQGYSKCSTAIVSDEAFITSDLGIEAALIKSGFDVLLVPPGDIVLPGLDYGFIGGCCGLISNDKLAFFGSLKHYAHGEAIIEFLKTHNVEPIYLRDGKLYDRGSLLCNF